MIRRAIAAIFLAAVLLALGASTVAPQRVNAQTQPDSRDLLLAALGVATIDCLGTVGPSTFSTASGKLTRTFDSCGTRDPSLLEHIDALLGVQSSAQGIVDDLGGHYVAAWDAFTESFPYRRIRTCPTWKLMNVLDAPTTESVARFVENKWEGKENRRYYVSTPECRRGGQCAVKRAAACAGGFGELFLIATDAKRTLVEVDPAWWLVHYENPEDAEKPFVRNPHYFHGWCERAANNPGSQYASLAHVGQQCCYWGEAGQKVYTDGKYIPIDCDEGPDEFFCMSYCTGSVP